MTDARDIANRAWYNVHTEGNCTLGADTVEYARQNYSVHVINVCEIEGIAPDGKKAEKARQIIRDEKIDG